MSPRWEVIESRAWRNARTGQTASIYGSTPWARESDRPDWAMEVRGYTLRDNRNGTVGAGRAPFPEREAADAAAARLNEISRGTFL